MWRVFFCTESKCVIWKSFFQKCWLFWNECKGNLSFSWDSQDLPLWLYVVSMTGTISGISSQHLIDSETCHEIHLACKSDLKRRRRTVTWLLAVIHLLYRNILLKICACLGWNRCQICPEGMDQRLLPTHTTHTRNSLQLNYFFYRSSFFFVWVLHEIHMKLIKICILSICTCLTVSSVRKYVVKYK